MRAESAPASMLPAVCLAVLLLAAAGVQHIDAAAPAACTATPKCNLSQCPCYAKQIDGSKYARPAGCVPSVRCPAHRRSPMPCRWSRTGWAACKPLGSPAERWASHTRCVRTSNQLRDGCI